MKNSLYQMMITNIKTYLKSADTENPDTIDAFRFSEVLAICTGKLKEDIVIELVKE